MRAVNLSDKIFKVWYNISMDEQQVKDLTQETVEKLLELLEIEAEVTTEAGKDDEGFTASIIVNPQSEAGLLIGSHGTTLNAIQSFISLSLKQKTGEWVRIMLDVGEWRQKHNEQLEELAKSAAERARETGESQHLYNLSPSQRRVVHMTLSQEEGIETSSEGEGIGRYLVVSPATSEAS